jgi:CRP-like cAMP-binding protein
MPNAFVRKMLSYTSSLSPDDVDVLERACRINHTYDARHDLIREGDKPGSVIVLLGGWACRYKLLPEGGRQITAFLMPGDFCDMHVAVLDEMDHSIATLTEASVALISRHDMEELIALRPSVTHAFWRTQLVDEGILRAWIVSMGRRNAAERVAHLLCELYVRASLIGLIGDEDFELPLTQVVLADALGLTPVHVNRVLRAFKAKKAVRLTRGKLLIVDTAKLARIAGFDDNYLHRRLGRGT